MRARLLALGALLVTAAACNDASEPASDPPGLTIDEAAERLNCVERRPVDEMELPIRGKAASRGIACIADGVHVHLFARAPAGDPDSPVPAVRMGGSLENIERTVLLGYQPALDDCSAWLTVGDSWFLVARDRDFARTASERLDGRVQEPRRATSPVSYTLPGCES